MKWFYYTFLFNYFYTDCILIVTNPDDGHRCDWNMLVTNNTMDMLMKVKEETSTTCTWPHPLTLLSRHVLPPAMSQGFGQVYQDVDFRGSPVMTRSEMVLEMLVYSPFNPLMQLLAQWHFTEFSYPQSFKLQKTV